MVAPATVSPEQIHAFRSAGKPIEMIDVRTPAEYREMHVDIARLEPLSSLAPARIMASRQHPADEPLYVICRSGDRAARACARFTEAGYANAVKVEGGTLACERAGVPVVRGKKAVSLERQVRIAAGSLVLGGAVLSLAVSPWWMLLPAFVGGGLAFAGVTDTCGMGMLLARMPWNRS